MYYDAGWSLMTTSSGTWMEKISGTAMIAPFMNKSSSWSPCSVLSKRTKASSQRVAIVSKIRSLFSQAVDHHWVSSLRGSASPTHKRDI